MKTATLLTLACVALALPGPALAYIGPGAGLGAIGGLIALVGSILLLIVGFVWYPVKRIMRGRAAAKAAEDKPADDN